MINNRQGGRRRGRGGGGRAPNMNPGAGNRQDNRQRGNAAQLLEKYKGLARDTQMQGDRVQTEYYLQFADHYYRILNENRARFEEQRRQRGEGGYEAAYEEDEQEELEAAAEPRDRQPAAEFEPRESRHEGRGDERRPGNGEYRGRRPRPRYGDEGDRYSEAEGREEPADERLAADILPPSIGAMSSDEGEDTDEAPRAPRRRPRRPRGEPGEEIAPAA